MQSLKGKEKIVMSTSGKMTENKEKICFYYSEAAISHTFVVDSNEKVLDIVPDLFQQFLQSNSLLNSLSTAAKSKLTCSILPTVSSPNVSFNQLRRLNSGGNSLVLVTVSDESPLVEELMKFRENKLLLKNATDEALHESISNESISSSYNKLEQKVALLEASVAEERQKADLERQKADLEREAAENERQEAKRRYENLMTLFSEEKIKRQRLCRRILMEKCRSKLAEMLSVGIFELSTIRSEVPKWISSDAFQLLIRSSDVRSEANEIAHESSEDELADCVLSCHQAVARDSLTSMFRFVFGRDPELP